MTRQRIMCAEGTFVPLTAGSTAAYPSSGSKPHNSKPANCMRHTRLASGRTCACERPVCKVYIYRKCAAAKVFKRMKQFVLCLVMATLSAGTAAAGPQSKKSKLVPITTASTAALEHFNKGVFSRICG